MKKGEPQSRPFFLPEAIEQARARFIERLKEEEKTKGVEFQTFVRARSLISGDPAEICEMLLFLLENSLEAIDERGRIYLSAEESQGMACIYVQDNGKGIFADPHSKISDNVATLPAYRKGLGLIQAQDIVRRHGGKIFLENSGPHGTTFLVRLPLLEKKPSPKKRAMTRWIRDSRILIISDDFILGGLLRDTLMERGAQVILEQSITKALKLFKKKNIQLVLADLDPEGLQPHLLIDLLRRERPDVPVFLFFKGDRNQQWYHLLNKGAITLVVKPFYIQRILEAIGEAIFRIEKRAPGVSQDRAHETSR